MKPEEWKLSEVINDKVDPQELMLGDWVVLNYDECTDLIVRITGIHSDCVDVDIPWSKSEGELWDMQLVHPIRVTKELLEQIGLEHDKNEDMLAGAFGDFNGEQAYFFISKDHRITINNVDRNSSNEWYVHIDNEDMNTILGGEFTFLHELQHLYKLGQIKEKINIDIE